MNSPAPVTSTRRPDQKSSSIARWVFKRLGRTVRKLAPVPAPPPTRRLRSTNLSYRETAVGGTVPSVKRSALRGLCALRSRVTVAGSRSSDASRSRLRALSMCFRTRHASLPAVLWLPGGGRGAARYTGDNAPRDVERTGGRGPGSGLWTTPAGAPHQRVGGRPASARGARRSQDTSSYYRSRVRSRAWKPAPSRGPRQGLSTAGASASDHGCRGGDRAGLRWRAERPADDRDTKSPRSPRVCYWSGTIQILTCSAVSHPEKNAALLLDAIHELEREHILGHFISPGPGRGPLDQYVADRVVELGLAETVTLAGSYPFRRAAPYRASDMFLHVSLTEGVPPSSRPSRPGIPVVATDVGGVSSSPPGGHAAVLARNRVRSSDWSQRSSVARRSGRAPPVGGGRLVRRARELTLEREGARVVLLDQEWRDSWLTCCESRVAL